MPGSEGLSPAHGPLALCADPAELGQGREPPPRAALGTGPTLQAEQKAGALTLLGGPQHGGLGAFAGPPPGRRGSPLRMTAGLQGDGAPACTG